MSRISNSRELLALAQAQDAVDDARSYMDQVANTFSTPIIQVSWDTGSACRGYKTVATEMRSYLSENWLQFLGDCVGRIEDREREAHKRVFGE